jgi:hypothetical protein
MNILQVHRVVLTLAQSERDRDRIAVLVMYGVQKCGKYLYEQQDVWYWQQAVF